MFLECNFLDPELTSFDLHRPRPT